MDSMPEPKPERPARRGLHALRTGLLIAGSALFGGLAVVLWNRGSLARLRQPAEPGSAPPAANDPEDD